MEECRRPWSDLMHEVLVDVFRRLGFEDRYVVVGLVCKAWARAAKDAGCWAVVDMEECFLKTEGTMAKWWNPEFKRSIDSMVRNVVDWSCGTLVELHTRHCSDDALTYVATRCPLLRSLSVKESPNFTDASSLQIASMCPNLQQLDITDCLNVSACSLKEFGTNCKGMTALKRNVLTLENNWQKRQFVPWQYLQAQPVSSSDEEAAVVGTLMPNLRHLEYRYSVLSDAGLALIVQGCPNLEHVDLCGCKRLSVTALDSANEKLEKLKFFNRPTSSNYVASLRYGHWQLYSERFQHQSFQF